MQRYLDGLKKGGTRPQRAIVYDEEFILYTLPSTSRGTAKVIAGKGVKYHHIFYHSPEFRCAAVHWEVGSMRVTVPLDTVRAE